MEAPQTFTTLYQGDCLVQLPNIEDGSIDLIITSPPYANQRKGTYSGVHHTKYVEWFVPIAHHLKRVLKPTGSFFLNLKAHCYKGERLLYPMELILALRNEVGFKFIDEYIWYKSALPGVRRNRLKNAWEPIYHFSRGKNYINHEAIQIKSKCTFANKRGYRETNKTTGNIGGYHEIADQKEGLTEPDNMLYFPSALLGKKDERKHKHPAKFPRELVLFLIDGFCPPGGTVCDPFMGSGVTALAAQMRDRECIGIELKEEYCEMTRERLRT